LARRAFLVRLLPVICMAPAVASGCVTSSAPHRSEVANPDVAVQSGKLSLAPHTNRDVYYVTPYAAPPDLAVPSHWGNAVVVIQTPTHFRVTNVSDSDLTVDWKASGLKAPLLSQPVLGAPVVQRPTPAATVQPVAASQPAAAAAPQEPRGSPQSPGDGLPAEPVPVAAPR
jgi:hypothetical protein